jgi:hypothetical protein
MVNSGGGLNKQFNKYNTLEVNNYHHTNHHFNNNFLANNPCKREVSF